MANNLKGGPLKGSRPFTEVPRFCQDQGEKTNSELMEDGEKPPQAGTATVDSGPCNRGAGFLLKTLNGCF